MENQAIRRSLRAFTLIELLVVISIISLLISILLPSLSRAREQGKNVHCLARLKEIGTAIATYENMGGGALPPARWTPDLSEFPLEEPANEKKKLEYGWAEILYAHVYRESVFVRESYPVLRNTGGRQWEKYFLCKAAGEDGPSSGHYRVYLPSWSTSSNSPEKNGKYTDRSRANPSRGAIRENIRPRMPLIGDANPTSERGDGIGDDDCSFIDAGEANFAGTNGRDGNRFSDRHYGGTNFLFQDLHGEWSTRLREELARDFDLNGVDDVER